jgi:hypothetical protein
VILSGLSKLKYSYALGDTYLHCQSCIGTTTAIYSWPDYRWIIPIIDWLHEVIGFYTESNAQCLTTMADFPIIEYQAFEKVFREVQ